MPHTPGSAFQERHIGPDGTETAELLATVGAESLEDLIARAVPEEIRARTAPDLPAAATEQQALAELRQIAQGNRPGRPLLGLGYHGTFTPSVIRRHLFENPAWYTTYTPYQSEISQGRLELLFHFQTLVCELTGHPATNASLLDEPTACAEAAAMAVRHSRGKRTGIILAGEPHPQCRDVLATRLQSTAMHLQDGPPDGQTAAVLIPWPDTYGLFPDPAPTVTAAQTAGAMVIAVADPLALTLLAAPASWGADIVVGSMQRYGVPMGYGGPHAAYIAAPEKLARLMPGRIVGESVDANGTTAYRLALQTREQHIRREKATSNICTAQALLANMAAAYAIWHGPEGLQRIARQVHSLAARLAAAATEAEQRPAEGRLFDTVTLQPAAGAGMAVEGLRTAGYEPRQLEDGRIAITFDETSTEDDLVQIASALDLKIADTPAERLPDPRREVGFLSQRVFHAHHSETAMMRYLQSLAAKDLALDRTMIPLGSCTMKLNPAAAMEPVGWPEFSDLHPFARQEDARGYARITADLESWLGEITGFDAVSLQPNAGSQGEYAGLLAVRRYHQSRGEPGRNICIIPDSAHGTNPASATLAGLEVMVVSTGDDGRIDLQDLERKTTERADQIAACMITYPSTHGVFEPGIKRLCEIVHGYGGQVYLDGANLNAMAGIARPGDLGADVCHMNLHKTFCIPHGGGGPGIGPIGVKRHLAPFLPGHWMHGTEYAVAGAPFGSAGILPIVWMYIRMMGADGLRCASAMAILNANYISRRLEGAFPTAYRDANGFVAHECILDARVHREKTGVRAEDIAKRLIDYGFHAPTMEWPVGGTLMVEPTESEDKAELDRFCDAMLAIAGEIHCIESGEWPTDDNPLVNAPHCLADALVEPWERPYLRMRAFCPPGVDPARKYFPPVARIDNAHGDRNLVCACPPVAAQASGTEESQT